MIELFGFILKVIIYGILGYVGYKIYLFLSPIFIALSPAVEVFWQGFTTLYNTVSSMGDVLNIIKGFVTDLVSKIGSLLSSVSGLPAQIASSITSFVRSITGPMQSAIDTLKNAGLCDERIKENIQPENTNIILEKLNNLPLKNYNYIDKNIYKGEKVCGLIAQDVINIIPEAVTIHKDFLPNIYKYAQVENIIESLKENTEIIEIKSESLEEILMKEQKQKVKLILDNISVELVKGANIKLLIDNNSDIQEILDFTENSITVYKSYNIKEDSKVLVYGTEIDDFHKLDRSYLGILCIGAIQELTTQNKKLVERIELLEKKLI